MKRFVTLFLFVVAVTAAAPVLAADSVTCWFPPGFKSIDQAQAIASVLSKGGGVEVKARVATSYAEILTAFSGEEKHLVYAGSFAQAIIMARKLGTPLAQNVDGKELYAGIMIHKIGENPKEILASSPQAIAFAIGASSGESSAKAATAGKANVGVNSHAAAVEAVVTGKAQAAVVKDGWWQSNQSKYPGMAIYEIPKISLKKNPDNVLTASSKVPAALAAKFKSAAFTNPAYFGPGAVMKPFSAAQLNFSLDLMMQGKIDPLTYKW